MATGRVERGPYAGLTAAQYQARRQWSVAIGVAGVALVGIGIAGVLLRDRSWARWPQSAAHAVVGVGAAAALGGTIYFARWNPLRALRQEDRARMGRLELANGRTAALQTECLRHTTENPGADWSNPRIARSITEYRAHRARILLGQLGTAAGRTILTDYVGPFVTQRVIPAALNYLFGR
jgi:hypothetical protein